MQNHTKHGKATASDLSHYRQLFVMLVLGSVPLFWTLVVNHTARAIRASKATGL
jgi:hypothetical protein